MMLIIITSILLLSDALTMVILTLISPLPPPVQAALTPFGGTLFHYSGPPSRLKDEALVVSLFQRLQLSRHCPLVGKRVLGGRGEL